jgi:hypothetical protein
VPLVSRRNSNTVSEPSGRFSCVTRPKPSSTQVVVSPLGSVALVFTPKRVSKLMLLV